LIRPEASAAGRKRPAKPLSVGELIVAQEAPLVAALHARHDRLRAAEFERARRQRAAERY
jgi:hypothetical protein